MANRPYLSVVIPVYNEEKNIPVLLEELAQHLAPYDYELIFIDDGCVDKSYEILKEKRESNRKIKIIRFNGNYGQHAAFAAGFQVAKGDLVAMIDSDLQNDPAELPRFINEIENNGFAAAFGWRVNRENSFFMRRIPSKMFNFMRNRFLKHPLHDYGCALNVFRREFIDELSDNLDFLKHITTYIASKGIPVTEVKIHERKRSEGKSRYNFMRLLQLSLDLLITSASKPIATTILMATAALSVILCFTAFIVGYPALKWGEVTLLEYIIYPYMFFMGGLVSAVLALINERASGLFRHLLKKPVYIVKEFLE